MIKIATSLLAGTAFLGLVGIAHGADMGSPLRGPAVVQPLGGETASTGGWYLRGDVGGAFSQTPNLVSEEPGFPKQMLTRSVTDAPTVQIGIGYQFNEYLRGDITGEYVGSRRFRGLGTYGSTYGTGANAAASTNYATYDGDVRSLVLLANAYVDLGNYNGITPYVGAGIGAAYNTMSNVDSLATFYVPVGAGTTAAGWQTPETGWMDGKSKWNLAWALHTGMSWDITPNAKFDIGYSYKNLGSVKTGDEHCQNTCGDVLKFKDLAIHDVHAGLRWTFDQAAPKAPVYSAPVVAKY